MCGRTRIANDWRAEKWMTVKGQGYSEPPQYKMERAAPFTSYQSLSPTPLSGTPAIG
jgi:hypothetical protein